MKKWTGNLGAEPVTRLGRLEPFNERTELRREIAKRQLKRYRRDQRMGLLGRQVPMESSKDYGERLLVFAEVYRLDHPGAPLSEVDDALRERDAHRTKAVPLHGPDSSKFFDEHKQFGTNGSGIDQHGEALPLLEDERHIH